MMHSQTLPKLLRKCQSTSGKAFSPLRHSATGSGAGSPERLHTSAQANGMRGRALSPLRYNPTGSRAGSPERPQNSATMRYSTSSGSIGRADATQFGNTASRCRSPTMYVSSRPPTGSYLGRSSRPTTGSCWGRSSRPSTGRPRSGLAMKLLPQIADSALSFDDIFHRSCTRAFHSRASRRYATTQTDEKPLVPGIFCNSKHLLRNARTDRLSTAKRASFGTMARMTKWDLQMSFARQASTKTASIPVASNRRPAIAQANSLKLSNEWAVVVEELDDEQELAELLRAPDKEETLALFNGQRFSDSEIARMRKVFAGYTLSGSDEVHEEDLQNILNHLGYLKIPEESLREMVTATTQYSTLNFDEFMSFMERAKEFECAEIRKCFETFDKDNSGELSAAELADLLKSLGITPFKSTMHDALSFVDEDGSGSVDFHEFALLLMIFKKTEGFSHAELKKLHRIFKRFASWQERASRHMLSSEQSKEALLYMFGSHCAEIASSLMSDNDHNEMDFHSFVVWARRVREAEVESYRQEFASADDDHDGSLDTEDIKTMLKQMGYTPLKTLVNDVLGLYDTDGGGGASIDFDEFVNMMQRLRTTDGFTRDELETYQQLFQEFDTESEGSINAVQASAMLRRLGISTEIERAEAMLQTVDRDNSNSLDFQEFLRLMRLHREEALTQTREVFDRHAGKTGEISLKQSYPGLLALGFPEAIAKRATKFYKTWASDSPTSGSEDPSQIDRIDFDDFVALTDICRQFFASRVVRQAGFSDSQLEGFAQLFRTLDADGSGALARLELVEFCKDRGVPLRSKEDRNELFRMVEEARTSARIAGLKPEQCGQKGSPEVPYWVFIHLMRVLQTAKDIELLEHAAKMTYELSPAEVELLKKTFGQKWQEREGSVASGDVPETSRRIDADTLFELVEQLGITLTVLLREQVIMKLWMEIGEVSEGSHIGFENFVTIVTWLGNAELTAAANQSRMSLMLKR